jgi:hypothetical protein
MNDKVNTHGLGWRADEAHPVGLCDRLYAALKGRLMASHGLDSGLTLPGDDERTLG